MVEVTLRRVEPVKKQDLNLLVSWVLEVQQLAELAALEVQQQSVQPQVAAVLGIV